MSISNRIARFSAASAACLALVIVAGADDKTRTIKADELSFEAPAAWKSQALKTAMRKAQLKIDPASGDPEGAELVLFVFPNGAGTVQANIKRWEDGFNDPDGKPPRAKVEEKKGKNVDVTRVEVAGRYVAAVTPGAPARHDKPGFRLLGAIVQTPTKGYFFRMVGPDATVKAAGPEFDALIESIKKTEE